MCNLAKYLCSVYDIVGEHYQNSISAVVELSVVRFDPINNWPNKASCHTM